MKPRNPTTFTSLGFITTKSNPDMVNPSIGTATLVGGTATVSNTWVTANDIVFMSVVTPGGTEGFLSAAVTAGTGFTITSSSSSDTSTVGYLIVRQN
ncbi:hypothetical protein [Caudoviricetes sp.]|nr:hypothetical protein [Caudoviricetes sp.]